MSQIRATIIGVIALIIMIFIWSQARSIGAPPLFGFVIIFMIILIVFRVAQSWLRGY
jgi:energy-coupling factor transporter transmembrane protein EcfT